MLHSMFTGKLDSVTDDVDAEAMEVLNELNLLSQAEDHQHHDLKNDSNDWSKGVFLN